MSGDLDARLAAFEEAAAAIDAAIARLLRAEEQLRKEMAELRLLLVAEPER